MGKVVYLCNNVKNIKKMKTKVSSSYTIKAFVKNVERLKEQGLIDAEASLVLDNVTKYVVKEYQKRKFEAWVKKI